MSDDQLRDEAITIFLAGHETTAIALTFAWMLLSRHPDVRDRLEAEVDALGDRAPTHADLPRLQLTHRIVRESLRLGASRSDFRGSRTSPSAVARAQCIGNSFATMEAVLSCDHRA